MRHAQRLPRLAAGLARSVGATEYAAVDVVARLPSSGYKPVVASESAASGRVSLISFPLEALPPTVFADLTITATIPGHGEVEYTRNFQRAPPPTNPNITVAVVDHASRGMLLGRGGGEAPWLPFLALGWFNSAFTYAAEGTGDSSFAPPVEEVSPLLISGADRSKEWVSIATISPAVSIPISVSISIYLSIQFHYIL